MRRRTQSLFAAVPILAATLAAAGPANAAGYIATGRASASVKCSAGTLACQPASYVLRPDPPLPGATTIDPINGATFTNSHYMFVRFNPPALPAEWPGPVQGITARALVDGDTGTKFNGFFCRVSDSSVCYGGVDSVHGGGLNNYTMSVGTLPPSVEQRVRFGMIFTGTSGANTVNDTTALHADVFYYALDEWAPSLTLNAGPDNARTVFGADDAPVSASIDVSDNTQVASSSLTVDGGGFPNGGNVGDGVHSIAASACDIASPANCSSTSRTITVDTLPPSVSRASTAPFKTTTPTLQFDAADPQKNGYASGVGSVAQASPVLYVDGAPRPAQAVRNAQGFAVTPNAPLSQGDHQVGLLVRDGVGNDSAVGVPDNGTITVDTEAPVISRLTPADNQVDVPTLPTISASAADAGSGIAAATLSLDGNVVGSGDDASVSYTPQSELTPGRHTAEVKARDGAGNESTMRWGFTVKAAPAGDAGGGDGGGGFGAGDGGDFGGGGFADDGGAGGGFDDGSGGGGSGDDGSGSSGDPVGQAGLVVDGPGSVKSARATKRGIQLTVSCAHACRVTAKGRAGKTVVAAGALRMKAEGIKKLTLRFTKAGRKLVARKHPSRLAVAITARAKSGKPATVKRTVRLTY